MRQTLNKYTQRWFFWYFLKKQKQQKKQPGHHHQIFKNRNSHILYTKHKIRRRKRQRTASGLRGRAMMMITCYRDMGHAAGQGKRRRWTRTRRGLTAPRLPKVVQQIIVVFIVFFFVLSWTSHMVIYYGYFFTTITVILFCYSQENIQNIVVVF